MSEKKSVNLALQGGGAHGAFTWGVLSRLIDEPLLDIAAITGTSAGALNGAAFKAGWVQDGRHGARAALDWLWQQISNGPGAVLSPWLWQSDPGQISQSIAHTPGFLLGDTLARSFSPYMWGPFYNNPLEPILQELDFDQVCCNEGPQLFVCATCVRTGKIRVFSGDSVSADAVMASACLPTLFQAVEIFDLKTNRLEAYWDGGYSGNPALFPLFNKGLPEDVVIVNINPLNREELPKTPQDIQNRINEISFNSSLLRELRAIEFVQRLLQTGKIAPGEMSKVNVHIIADDALMNELNVATKLVPNAQVISALKEAGERAADGFLKDHWSDLGVRSSVNLREMFG